MSHIVPENPTVPILCYFERESSKVRMTAFQLIVFDEEKKSDFDSLLAKTVIFGQGNYGYLTAR